MESKLLHIIILGVFLAVAIGVYLLITGRLQMWINFILRKLGF